VASLGEHPPLAIHLPPDAVPHEVPLRVPDAVELVDAPGYVVPRRFEAVVNDLGYPVLIRLQIRVDSRGRPVEPWVVLEPRVDRTPELVDLNDGDTWRAAWRERRGAPYLHVGSIPELPVPRLLRDALAFAAMPSDQPLLSEMGLHVDSVATAIGGKRAPRVSHHERAVMRSAVRGAPEGAPKHEEREHVHSVLAETFPYRWKRDDRDDRKTPDYDRLRPHLRNLEREDHSLEES
jgi:hypothetical protein